MRTNSSRTTETTARMIAAQIAVHQNSSMVSPLERLSVMLSRTALTTTEKRPRVSSVRGNVRMRRIVPRTALTIPKRADTQMYPQTPPDTSMPERSQLVTANEAARIAQLISSATSKRGAEDWAGAGVMAARAPLCGCALADGFPPAPDLRVHRLSRRSRPEPRNRRVPSRCSPRSRAVRSRDASARRCVRGRHASPASPGSLPRRTPRGIRCLRRGGGSVGRASRRTGGRSSSRTRCLSQPRCHSRSRRTAPRAPARDARAVSTVAGGRTRSELAAPHPAASPSQRRCCVDVGTRLRSIVFGTNWPLGEALPARCEFALRRPWTRPWHRVPVHEAPSDDCDCGIWAAKDSAYAMSFFHLYDDLLGQRSLHRVVGSVCLWGSVVEGSLGWRATRAYPAHIYVPTHRENGRRVNAENIARGLADYGVPVEIVGKVGERVGPALAEIRQRERNRTGELSLP